MWGNETGKVSSAVGGNSGQLLPGNGDLVAIKNGTGGYIGGVRGNDKLRIVPHCQGWEHFFFELVDNSRFALRQKESNHYLGGVSNNNEQLFLANQRQECEIFTYSLLPNGMVNILNSKMNKISRRGDWLYLSDQNTLAESWNFEMIQKNSNPTSSTGATNMAVNSSVNSTGSTNANGLIPPPGTVVCIESRTGGFIGRVKGKGQNLGISKDIGEWEKFIIESKGNGKWSFKQKVSGLYIGSTCQKDERVKLTDLCQTCEQFELETRDPGWLGIKVSAGNYMKHDNDKVVWQNVCLNGEHWRFVPEPMPIQPGGMMGQATNQSWGQNQGANWGQQGQGQWGGQQQGQWGQPQGQWGNQGQQGGWNQGQQGGWNQGQGGWNQGQPQQGGFIPDFLKNVQAHMHQSGNQGNQTNQSGFNSFQGGFGN